MTDDLHELSALYALDVLDAPDRARFEAHLASCDRCSTELESLRAAASSLAFVGEAPPPPPPELRERILGTARVEGQNVVRLQPRRSWAVSAAAAVAVAASAIAVGFGIWAATLHHSLASERAASKVLRDPLARHIPVQGAPGELVVASSGDAVLNVDLPKPPDGSTYEAWVADPEVHAAGTFDGGTTALKVRVPRGAQVMVTLERSGGTSAPSRKPLLSTRA
jgi:anti-sigma factor RsiW